MGFFDRKEPGQQAMDLMTAPPQALLALYGLINQGASNVANNLSSLMNLSTLKEKLLSQTPWPYGNPQSPEALNSAIDTALNYGPMGVGMMVGPKATGFANMRQFSNMADKMPRAEISDASSKFVKNSITSNNFIGIPKQDTWTNDSWKRLGDILDHKELYSKYPWMKDEAVSISISKDIPKGKGTGEFTPDIEQGAGQMIRVFAHDKADAKNVLLHEIQHRIQQHEGFASGGSPDYGLTDAGKKIYDQMAQPIREAAEKARVLGDIATYDKLKNELQMVLPNKANYLAYKRLAGEIEARDTAARQALTDLQRMSHMPYESQNIPLSEWIVRMNEGSPAYSLTDAIQKGIQVKNKPNFDKLETRLGIKDILKNK